MRSLKVSSGMTRWGFAGLLLAGWVAFGCASAGRDFDTTHAADIEKGVQDKAQIRSWFGEPYQVAMPLSGHPLGCMERWTYTYAYSDRGGARTKAKTLIIDFDANGKVCDHAFVKQ
ncbi:MAG TPA: outer membrane protein assembly factor BamE [Deltaproteobacteria bacterium]|nr:outer membrane protein assembly factor BamE [Deltaproteobacteria bacterium]